MRTKPDTHHPQVTPARSTAGPTPGALTQLSPAPLSSVHYQCSPVTPPTLTCLNVSQAFAPPHSPYSLGFYSVAQSLLSLHSLAIHFLTLSADPLIPHPSKFCPLLRHNLSSNLLPLKFREKGKKNAWFHTSFALIAYIFFARLHPHRCHLSLISSTVSPSPFRPLSCSPVC